MTRLAGRKNGEILAFQIRCLNLGDPVLEYHFHPTRKWRLDVALVEPKVAVEIDGGVFLPGGGRHTRGAGYRADLEKLNEALCLGWRVIRCLPEQVTNGTAIDWISRCVLGEQVYTQQSNRTLARPTALNHKTR